MSSENIVSTLVEWVDAAFAGLLGSISKALQVMPPTQQPALNMITVAAKIVRQSEYQPEALRRFEEFILAECARNGRLADGVTTTLIGVVPEKAQPVEPVLVSSPAVTPTASVTPVPTTTSIVAEKPAPKPVAVAPGRIINQQVSPAVTAKPKQVPSSAPAPARTLASGDFAGKMIQATADIGLGPLGKFWKLLENKSEGHIYWDSLRRALEVVLSGKLLQSDEDWKRFVVVYRHNAFNTTKTVVEELCEQMPKEIMRDLLFEGQECFLAKIRHLLGVPRYHDSAPYFVSMVLELALVSGGPEEDVRLLVGLCERVASRMVEWGTISSSHFLVKRIARLASVSKPIPDSKYADLKDLRPTVIDPAVEDRMLSPGLQDVATVACSKVNGVPTIPVGTSPAEQQTIQ